VLGTANAATVQLPLGSCIVLCLDGDPAGRKAAAVAAKALHLRGHEVRVADLPEGQDPAAMVQEACGDR
jgi:DNA primase